MHKTARFVARWLMESCRTFDSLAASAPLQDSSSDRLSIMPVALHHAAVQRQPGWGQHLAVALTVVKDPLNCAVTGSQATAGSSHEALAEDHLSQHSN